MRALLALSVALVLGCAGRAADRNSCAGVTEPVFDVALSLAEPGIVTAEHFKEGDFVHANDVILEIDHHLEQLEVDRRQLVMDNLKADWESTKLVFEKSASVSHDELLKKEADYRVAAIQWQSAVEELNRRKLRAPAAGVITELHVRVGEACTAYQPIVRLVDTRRCYFVCDLEANLSAGLKTGQGADIEIDDAGKPLRVHGTIVFISPVVDSASGLQKVKLVFDNADGRVRPGLAGRLLLK